MRAEPRWWRGLGLALGLALMGLVLWRSAQVSAQLRADWRGAAWPLVAAACACALAAQGLFATAWHLLVGADAPRSWRHDAARWSLSLGGKYLPGKVFHGALRIGAYRMGARGGEAAGSRVAASFLRETLLSLCAACTWVAVHALSTAQAPRALAWPMLAAAFAFGAAAVAPLPTRLLAWSARWHAPAGTAFAPSPVSRTASAWALQATAYLAYGSAVWLLAQALVPAHAPGLFTTTGAFCFAGVAGVAAFMVPAGIGVREAALAWYLAAWMPAGSAALLAIASRLCLSLAEAIAIGIGLLLVRAERQ